MTGKLSMAGLQRDVDRVEAAQTKHEAECALRYGELNSSIRDLKDGMKWVIRLAIGIMCALIGWLAVQLWEAEGRNPPTIPVEAPR